MSCQLNRTIVKPRGRLESVQACNLRKKAVYSIRVNSGWLGVGGNLRWIQSASMSNWGS